MADRKVELVVSAVDQMSSTLQTLQGELKKLGGELNTTQKQSKTTSDGFGMLGGAANLLRQALPTVGVAMLARELLNAGMAAERLSAQFKAAAGDAAAGAASLAFVRAEASRLGVDFVSAAGAYAKFMASVRGTSLEGGPAQFIFSSISEGVAALKLTAEDADRIFRQLSQIASKGKLTAEDLNVISESLPGVKQKIAEGLGLKGGMAELTKMMEDGKALASSTLPALAKAMHDTYGVTAVESATQAAASFARMKNEIFETSAAIGKYLTPAVAGLADTISDSLKKLRTEQAGGLGNFRFIFNDLMGIPNVTDSGQWYYPKSSSADLVYSAGGMAEAQRNRARAASEARAANAGKATKYPYSGSSADDLVYSAGLSDDELYGLGVVSVGMQAKLDEQLAMRAMQDKWRIDSAKAISDELFLTEEQLNQRIMQDRWATNESMFSAEAEFMAMRNSLKDDGRSMENYRLEQEKEALIQFYAMDTDNFEVYESRKYEIEEYYRNLRQAKEEGWNQMRAEQWRRAEEWKKTTAGKTYMDILSLTDSFNRLSHGKSKEALRAYQVMKSGETVITTGSAAMKAYDAMASIPYVGPILGAIAAGAVIAEGAVQLQSIWSVGPDGSGGSLGGGASAPSMSATPAAVTQPVGASAGGSGVTIVLKGVPMAKWIEEELIPEINQAGTRNVRIEYVPEA